ncbi:MAG: class I SAM-dependent DNA methyltransferase, partial [archaeon]|nr:class I SAM-dependent DNA methyltransferase [archaeon]
MNIEKLENTLEFIVKNLGKNNFIYDLLKAYNLPKASITRLKKGDYNFSENDGEILWKKKLFFREETKDDLHELIDKLSNDSSIQKHHPRFIIVTDFKNFLSIDTSTKDTLDISLNELPQYYDFFLPWAGIEKSQFQNENPADIKAAERMGRLYDLILETNPVSDEHRRHALNVFLSRLLFCFFAEDTGIFLENKFTNALASHTEEDGSDLQAYLSKLFNVLNLED